MAGSGSEQRDAARSVVAKRFKGAQASTGCTRTLLQRLRLRHVRVEIACESARGARQPSHNTGQGQRPPTQRRQHALRGWWLALLQRQPPTCNSYIAGDDDVCGRVMMLLVAQHSHPGGTVIRRSRRTFGSGFWVLCVRVWIAEGGEARLNFWGEFFLYTSQ